MQFLSYKFACVFEFELSEMLLYVVVNMLRAHSYIVLIFFAVNYCVARIGREKKTFSTFMPRTKCKRTIEQKRGGCSKRRSLVMRSLCKSRLMKIPHTNFDEDAKRFYQSAHLATMRTKSLHFSKFYLYALQKATQLDAIHSTNVRRPETAEKKNPLKFGKWLSSCCWCKKRKFVRCQGAEQFMHSKFHMDSIRSTRVRVASISDQVRQVSFTSSRSQRIDALFYSKMSF